MVLIFASGNSEQLKYKYELISVYKYTVYIKAYSYIIQRFKYLYFIPYEPLVLFKDQPNGKSPPTGGGGLIPLFFDGRDFVERTGWD